MGDNRNSSFLTDEDRALGHVSASISARRGQDIFSLIKDWCVPPPGAINPNDYRAYATARMRKPFCFKVRNMPISVWETLIEKQGPWILISRRM